MTKLIIILCLILLPTSAFAYDDPYSPKSQEIELRKSYDYNPANRYRGEIDTSGSVQMRNSSGDKLRGDIDRDGYGSLRDRDGNAYRVRPR